MEAISALHQRSERAATWHQRGIERLTGWIGRPFFLYTVLAFVLAWTVINVGFGLIGRTLDPAPFFYLQGLVALAALLMATMVLITQNRQLKLAEKRARLDLEISLLAEHKVAKVIALLEELRRDLPDVRDREDPEATAMGEGADPHAVAQALDEQIEGEVSAEEEEGLRP